MRQRVGPRWRRKVAIRLLHRLQASRERVSCGHDLRRTRPRKCAPGSRRWSDPRHCGWPKSTGRSHSTGCGPSLVSIMTAGAGAGAERNVAGDCINWGGSKVRGGEIPPLSVLSLTAVVSAAPEKGDLPAKGSTSVVLQLSELWSVFQQRLKAGLTDTDHPRVRSFGFSPVSMRIL